MENILNGTLTDSFIKLISFISLYFLLFLISKYLKDVLTPYKINDELTKKDNVAVSLIMCGYYLAVTLIFIGAFFGPSHGLQQDLISVSLYSLVGIMLLNLSRFINDKLILRKFCNSNQIIKEHNVGVASVQFGSYFATGLIAAAAIIGEGGGMLTFIVFFILGQLSLILFSMIYKLFIGYDIYEELGKKNISAGVAFGGTLIALGIVVTNGVFGNFIGWKESLLDLIFVNVIAFIFLPIIRVFMDKVIIPGDKLDLEIKEDQNLGAGFLEATVAISFALVLNIII